MIRVLAVDDDPGARETIHYILKKPRYDVQTASCGRQAIEFALQQPPGVMLLDLGLPDMTGLDVIRRLHAAGRMVPTVMISGFGTIRTAVDAIQLGALDFLEKPLDVEDIVNAVERAAQGLAGHPRSVIRADGLTSWARAVAVVVRADEDPTTVSAWAAVRCVAPATLRKWCETIDLPAKGWLDLGRVLRAAHLGGITGELPARFLRCADPRTVERLLIGGGLQVQGRPTIEDALRRQTFIDDRLAIEELRGSLRDLGIAAGS